MPMNVTAHKLKDGQFPNWREMVEREYDDWRADPHLTESWISFDCLAFDSKRNAVFCGVSSLKSDIFYRFDRAAGRFTQIDTHALPGSQYDAKFHRSLEWDDDGTLWAATALFHDVHHYHAAPGGKIIHYDPQSGRLELVATPVEHVYIQALALDRKRRILYATAFTPELLIRYDIPTGRVRTLTPLGPGYDLTQPEKLCLDADGNVWCTWRITRAWANDTYGPAPIRLLKYDPEADRLTYFQHGIPKMHEADIGKIESFIDGRDGYVYIGSAAGALYRLDPRTAAVTFVAKPACGTRITSFAFGPDDLLYFASGKPAPHLFRFNPRSDRITDLGLIRDERLGVTCLQVHDLVVADDGAVFCGENDVPERSSFLWECRIA
jgi:sugar lactone lactonase YvrE